MFKPTITPALILRIISNYGIGRDTVIGRYTYKVNAWTGDILRSKTADIGRQWIDHDGNRYDSWQIVGHM